MFKNENIYFALESIRECSLSIKVEFGHEVKSGKDKDAAELDAGPSVQENVIIINSAFKASKEEPPKTDKIDRYVAQFNLWPTIVQQQRETQRHLNEERRRKAIIRKKKQQNQQHIKNIFYLHRWKYIIEVGRS